MACGGHLRSKERGTKDKNPWPVGLPHPPTTRVAHTHPNHSKGRSHAYICVDIHYPLPEHICRLLVSRLLFLDDRFVRCRARPMQNLRPPEAPSPAKHQFPPIPGPKPQGTPRSPQSPRGRLSPLTLSPSKWTLDQAGACLRLDGSPCPLLCPFIVLIPHPPSPRLLSASLTFQPSPPPPTVHRVLGTRSTSRARDRRRTGQCCR